MKVMSEILSLFEHCVELENNEDLLVDSQVKSICISGDDVIITLTENQPVAYGYTNGAIIVRKKKESYLDPWCERVSRYLASLDLYKIDLAFLYAYIVRKEKGKDAPTQSRLEKILPILGWQQDEKERNIFLRPARQQRPSLATKKC